jgi:hypothetical protein
MAVEYVNRKGDRYYLHQGTTKGGKPKYYMSKKPGDGVEAIPEGFEIREDPAYGLVTLRRIKPTRIRPEEREQLARWARQLSGTESFLVDVEGDNLIVYASDQEPGETDRFLEKMIGPFAARVASMRAYLLASSPYSAMFRFALRDDKKRLFSVDRWCFLGSIDDWFPLASAKPLEDQARKYLPHLTRQSFFELM